MKTYNKENNLYNVLEGMQKKIDFFNSILESKKIINIQIHFFADNKHITIYQADSPYNLEHELRNLLEAMVDQITNDLEILKIRYNEQRKD
jgi:chaperone required for assembly of F1-ATPase